MLEQPRRASARVVSHMLTSHGGEIYIHALMTSRSILEDPPSISEGAGGRLTDYRISVCNGHCDLALHSLDKFLCWIVFWSKMSLQCFDNVGWATGRASGL